MDRPAPDLAIAQPARGFRYAVDSFWLTGFALEAGVPNTAVDLGTGSGIVALLLAGHGVDALGIDVREEWAPYWAQTLAASRPSGRIRLVQQDVNALTGRFELAVGNPPYNALGTGPTSPDPLNAAARTESTATLADFVRVGLAVADRLCLVIPAARVDEVRRMAPTRRTLWIGQNRALVEISDGPALADERCEPRDERAERLVRLARR